MFSHALLTRPQPQLDALASLLSATALTPVRMPAFRFAALATEVAIDDEWRRAHSHLLVFTSPRAVEFGLPALAPSMRERALVASLGPATSRPLAAAGFTPVQAPAAPFDSEALLETLDRSPLSPGACVILAAPGGREALQRGLEARGWQVRLAPVYERILLDPDPAAVAALETAERVLSVWTSGVALDHLLGSLSPAAREQVIAGLAVVVSERLAKRARTTGFREVRVAPGPGNPELAQCVRELVA